MNRPTKTRSIAFRNIPGPSVPQKEADTWVGYRSRGYRRLWSVQTNEQGPDGHREELTFFIAAIAVAGLLAAPAFAGQKKTVNLLKIFDN